MFHVEILHGLMCHTFGIIAVVLEMSWALVNHGLCKPCKGKENGLCIAAQALDG